MNGTARSRPLSSPSLRAIGTLLDSCNQEDGIDSVSLVHAIPFFAHERRTCRLILSRSGAATVSDAAWQVGLEAVIQPVLVEPIGTDWSSFRATGGESHSCLVALGSGLDEATRLAEAELGGNVALSGALLGYPPCCVDKYRVVETHAANWPTYYLNQSYRASRWCNRFALLRGGTCPTGYLFPCSLTCERAVEHGKANIACIDAIGLGRLATEIQNQSSRALYVAEGVIHPAGSSAAEDVAVRSIDIA